MRRNSSKSLPRAKGINCAKRAPANTGSNPCNPWSFTPKNPRCRTPFRTVPNASSPTILYSNLLILYSNPPILHPNRSSPFGTHTRRAAASAPSRTGVKPDPDLRVAGGRHRHRTNRTVARRRWSRPRPVHASPRWNGLIRPKRRTMNTLSRTNATAPLFSMSGSRTNITESQTNATESRTNITESQTNVTESQTNVTDSPLSPARQVRSTGLMTGGNRTARNQTNATRTPNDGPNTTPNEKSTATIATDIYLVRSITDPPDNITDVRPVRSITDPPINITERPINVAKDRPVRSVPERPINAPEHPINVAENRPVRSTGLMNGEPNAVDNTRSAGPTTALLRRPLRAVALEITVPGTVVSMDNFDARPGAVRNGNTIPRTTSPSPCPPFNPWCTPRTPWYRTTWGQPPTALHHP